jgi:hypothetical protein
MIRTLTLILAAALSVPLGAAVTTNIDMPISFELTPATCSQITSTISGQGFVHLVIVTSQDANGIWHVSVLHVANGTAVDTNGVQYRFDYHNHSTIKGPTSDGQPPNTDTGANLTPPYSFSGTDTFELTRGDGGPAIRSNVVGHFTVNSNGTVTLDFFKVGGELGCDPL